ncbi:MAG TPA: bifunctional shikimate kinase/3-dehydroquinate synthase [Acidimicrobiales bacterium]
MGPALREHVLLLGAMGSGKTTVGGLLATRLGRPFIDSDFELQKQGLSAKSLLVASGRDALHAVEADLVQQALATPLPAVIAAAASVVDDDATKKVISEGATTVYLRASTTTLVSRIADDPVRPIVGEVDEELAELHDPRRARYEELADFVVDVDGYSPEAIVERIVAALTREVTVPLGSRSYPVLIGPGVLGRLREVIPATAKRAAIVTQEQIGITVDPGIESATFYIGDGESAKSIATVERLCREFATFGLTRADVIVAVGGGVVTDAAGFAAACYHRGMAYVNVSTTLLGQIDAAVGGKTAVNIPEGKNLIGAFWQPAAVICDTDTLTTLPDREWRSGLGEMAKYAFLGVDNLASMSITDAVEACVQLKAEVVSEDEREGARRMLLNYGHTLAHALEAAGFADGPGRDGIDLRHGEAVSIGIAFAARLAEGLGRIDAAQVRRHLAVLGAYGLPTEIPAGIDVEEVLVRMARDKKATNSLTFILDSRAGCEIVPDVSADSIRAAFALSGPGSSTSGEGGVR